MNFNVLTSGEPQILKVTVRVPAGPKKQKIWLVVCDRDQSNTVFTHRYCEFTGERTFFVRMPLAPTVALVQIYNDAFGNRPQAQEDSFSIAAPGIQRMRLERKMDQVDMRNANVRSFVQFAQEFSYHAGVMDASTYRSGNGKFKIDYQDILRTSKGQESSTPARIDADTKIIEVSQRQFTQFTVPGRFAILCHEFAHCYLNARPESEGEADIQALIIYLSLGYPRIEAYLVFLETFTGSPSQLNQQRYKRIRQFIDDFENNKLIFDE